MPVFTGLLVVAAWQLNPLCLLLLPGALYFCWVIITPSAARAFALGFWLTMD